MTGFFERNVIRRTFGQVEIDVVWRLRYNENMYGGIKTLNWSIYVKRSHWAGHVVRMIDNNSKTNSGRDSRRKKVRWKAEKQVGRRSVV